MTRVAILTSTAPRHQYFAMIMAKAFDASLLVTQEKQKYYNDQISSSELIQQHFRDLRAAEAAEFSPRITTTPDITSVSDINDPVLIDLAKSYDVEAVMLFGTSILQNGWLMAFPDRVFNLHLGLSPYYRGSATLFWPFVNGELECLGTTIHLAVAKVDAGPILAQIKADFVPGDTYYSITNRLIRASIDMMPNVVRDYIAGVLLPVEQPSAISRAWRKADFTEEALRQALNFTGPGLTSSQIEQIAMSKKCPCLL